METEFLKTYIEVAKHRSFGKAADSLFISKQAVSYQMEQLERSAGARLFTRSSKGIELTEAGVLFLQGAKKILKDENHILGEIRKLDSACDKIRLCNIDYHVLLRPVTKLFSRRFPDIEIEYVYQESTREAPLVRDGIIDVGDTMYYPGYKADGLVYVKLLDMPYYCICPEGFTKDFAAIADLTAESVAIDFREFSGYYERHLTALKKSLPDLQVIHGTSRRIDVIFEQIRKGGFVISASTFVTKVSGWKTVPFEFELHQECGGVYKELAPKIVQDYVACAREVYEI